MPLTFPYPTGSSPYQVGDSGDYAKKLSELQQNFDALVEDADTDYDTLKELSDAVINQGSRIEVLEQIAGVDNPYDSDSDGIIDASESVTDIFVNAGGSIIGQFNIVQLASGGVVAATAADGDPVIGMALQAIAPGASGKILRRGRITTSDWSSAFSSPTLTPLQNYYVGMVGGRFTATVQSTGAVIVQCIGQAISSSTLDFNPSLFIKI